MGEFLRREGDFGAHYNPVAMYPQTDHFSFFDQGGLDVAVFGLSEVDRDGNVNTTFLNGRIAGVGGFPIYRPTPDTPFLWAHLRQEG